MPRWGPLPAEGWLRVVPAQAAGVQPVPTWGLMRVLACQGALRPEKASAFEEAGEAVRERRGRQGESRGLLWRPGREAPEPGCAPVTPGPLAEPAATLELESAAAFAVEVEPPGVAPQTKASKAQLDLGQEKPSAPGRPWAWKQTVASAGVLARQV